VAHLSLFGLVGLLVALALFVWRARPDSPVNRWFAAFAVFVASWVLGIEGLQRGTHLDGWARFTFASASLIPASFLAFMRAYPTPSVWPPPVVLRGTLLAGSLIAILSVATPLMVYDTAITPAGLSRKTGPLYPIFSIYFLVTWIIAIVVFISKWRNSRGIPRAQLQYLGAGIILSGVGATAANLLLPFATGRSTYSWIGPYFSLLLVAMVTHAIIRHRLMDLRLFINRGLASGLAVAIASAAFITIVRLVAPTWEAEAVPLNADFLIIALVVLVMLSTPSQRFLAKVIDPYLYRGRIDHASALRTATRQLSRLMQPDELSAELRQILNEARRVERANRPPLALAGEEAEEERDRPRDAAHLDHAERGERPDVAAPTHGDETGCTPQSRHEDHPVGRDPARQPAEHDRAEAGRELAEIGDPRPGVGKRADGMPDIAWCDVGAGEVIIEDSIGTQTVRAFRIAKYPTTYAQFQAFVSARDGYADERWWNMAPKLAKRRASKTAESNSPAPAFSGPTRHRPARRDPAKVRGSCLALVVGGDRHGQPAAGAAQSSRGPHVRGRVDRLLPAPRSAQ